MGLTLLDKAIINMVNKSDDMKKGPNKKDVEKSTTEVKSFMEDIDKDDENKVIEILKKYFIETSIHGLKGLALKHFFCRFEPLNIFC